ncbi:MAG: hypothetical protein ACLFN8_03580 [Candidatus Woesearchaeota archaeon]
MKQSTKKEQKRKRRNLIAGLVMLFLMVFSILAIALDNTGRMQTSFEFNNHTINQKVEYNDIFQQDILKYYTTINEQEIEFYFPPGTMNQININATNINTIKTAQTIQFTREPMHDELDYTANVFFFELLKQEYNIYSSKIITSGITNTSTLEMEQPIITCKDATNTAPVIKLSNTTGPLKITEIETYCFEIEGTNDNLLMISDYLLYKTHDVI